MKTFILGNGFIANHFSYTKIIDRLSATNDSIELMVNRYRPDVLINCLGYCGGANVDGCEINKSKTVESNLTIPTILADICVRKGIRLVHLGSGCIYYGESPNIDVSLEGPRETGWKETDYANPQSFYSRTKYSCDLILERMPNVAVLRLRMPISELNHPRNIITKLLNYQKVIETPNSITYVDDLVRAADWIIEKNKSGIYHIASPEPVYHSQILEEYRKYFPEHSYTKINEEQLSDLVVAPRSNCLLSVAKIQAEGFELTPAADAIQTSMKKYIQDPFL